MLFRSPPGAIIPPDQLQAMKVMPTMLVKAKIQQLGVDPKKYSVLTEHSDWIKLLQVKTREKAVFQYKKKKQLAENKANKNNAFAEKQKRVVERIAELEAQGVQFAQFKAMKEFAAEEKAKAKKNNKMNGVEGQAANLTAQLEDLEMDEIPMVKLGDASIAAPFTSKMPSIRSCVDIIRQGRCTLVTSMQMVRLFAALTSYLFCGFLPYSITFHSTKSLL